MTRIGGPHGHYRAFQGIATPKLSSLESLPEILPHTEGRTVPLSDLAKLILPDTVHASDFSKNPQAKRTIDALLALVAMKGLTDGVSGSA